MAFQIFVEGRVQGVGVRPFVYRLARQFQLKGWVRNVSNGVEIVVDGDKKRIREFLIKLQKDKPPLAIIQSIKIKKRNFSNLSEFQILRSSIKEGFTLIPPDVATCDECIKELYEKNDPRFNYFFYNLYKLWS
jgi:hydrogenase maturation protein HypF